MNKKGQGLWDDIKKILLVLVIVGLSIWALTSFFNKAVDVGEQVTSCGNQIVPGTCMDECEEGFEELPRGDCAVKCCAPETEAAKMLAAQYEIFNSITRNLILCNQDSGRYCDVAHEIVLNAIEANGIEITFGKSGDKSTISLWINDVIKDVKVVNFEIKGGDTWLTNNDLVRVYYDDGIKVNKNRAILPDGGNFKGFKKIRNGIEVES